MGTEKKEKMKYEKDLLLNLYRMMVLIRICEEGMVKPILEGEIGCPCHLYSGQEAIAAGVGACLQEKDFIFGTHRSHGHFIAKGGSINELFAEVYCKEDGCSRGRGGSMHLTNPQKGMLGSAPIVAGTISLAVGAALRILIKKENRVAVSFFGDGAVGEGVLYESLNFASLKKLPIIFVCENNLYATHMPIRECRVDPNIYTIAKPFGMESNQISGNDVLQVYDTTKNAVEKCKKGYGPIFIECLTYRMRGHVGPDDNIQGEHTDIRTKDEVEKWRLKDPIVNFERYLIDNHRVNIATMNKIKQKAADEVSDAIDFARNSIFPNKKELTNYVYA